MKKQTWLIIISAIVLVALLVGAVFLWKGFSAKPETGSNSSTKESSQKDLLADQESEENEIESTDQNDTPANQESDGSENKATEVTFEVILKDGTSREYSIKTDKRTLAEALVEKGLITYESSGMYTTIDGITADWKKDQGWWNIKKDGVPLPIGMNDQPIADGEHYEAVYTIGF